MDNVKAQQVVARAFSYQHVETTVQTDERQVRKRQKATTEARSSFSRGGSCVASGGFSYGCAPSAQGLAKLFSGCGMDRVDADAAGRGFSSCFPQPGACDGVPFMNGAGGLDAGQLAAGLLQAGFHPLAAMVGGTALAQMLSPEQFMQPLWNAMGGQGRPDLGALNQAYQPQAAAPGLGDAANGARSTNNALGAARRPRRAGPELTAQQRIAKARQIRDALFGGGIQAPPRPTIPRGVVRPQRPARPQAPQQTRPPNVTAPQIEVAGQNNRQAPLDRVNNIVQELYGRGAKVVDSGKVKGRLDAGDSVQTADGQTRVIGDKQFREVQMRTHLTEGAQMLDKAKAEGRGLGFVTDMRNPKFNAQFWQKDAQGRLQVKPGVRPSQAIDDVFANPNKYGVDCAAATHLVGLRAIRQTIGAEDFDRSHAGLTMQGWNSSAGKTLSSITGSTGAAAGPGGGPKPGDVAYIKNPDAAQAAWQGENLIYLGGGKYWGHPGGTNSKQGWLDWLNNNTRVAGSTTEAYMTTLNGDWGANRWAAHDLNQADSAFV